MILIAHFSNYPSGYSSAQGVANVDDDVLEAAVHLEGTISDDIACNYGGILLNSCCRQDRISALSN